MGRPAGKENMGRTAGKENMERTAGKENTKRTAGKENMGRTAGKENMLKCWTQPKRHFLTDTTFRHQHITPPNGFRKI